MIARLLDIYALEKGVALYSCDSATICQATVQRGPEPDESYCLGSDKDRPDLAIEIVITTRLLDRLSS